MESTTGLLLLADVTDKNIVKIQRIETINKETKKVSRINYEWNSNKLEAKFNRTVILTINTETDNIVLRVIDFNNKHIINQTIQEDTIENIWQAQYFVLVSIKIWMKSNNNYIYFNDMLKLHNYIAGAQKNIKYILNQRTKH